jgi:hypothetical protein
VRISLGYRGSLSGVLHLHLARTSQESSLQLLAAASMYFLANTVPVATVIALTEHKSLRSIFTDYYFWSFPHYLLGAGVAGLIGFFNRFVEWQSSLLVLPAIS